MHENTIISEILYLARVMITEKNLHRFWFGTQKPGTVSHFAGTFAETGHRQRQSAIRAVPLQNRIRAVLLLEENKMTMFHGFCERTKTAVNSFLHDSNESDCPKTGVDYMVTIYFIIVRNGRKATGNSDKNRLFQSE